MQELPLETDTSKYVCVLGDRVVTAVVDGSGLKCTIPTSDMPDIPSRKGTLIELSRNTTTSVLVLLDFLEQELGIKSTETGTQFISTTITFYDCSVQNE